ncbi:O-phosphoseryl-tRNA(Sec) selenium transferase [Drosophila guanche]|uniref:O-phosphoseryl-tRNA(Sec) selenium transferase n=2 Tax=Drosophila guanche TaxID=7266 RepID=A0A3B0JRV5_DROGU|nr:O-phosphoseryl-tRNA(Sec) selenium transferase [Drosophila guanche]SPP83122.1 blast:O-phosphoseryl-tRNA(Sec) selenium transferase [Drosophila guanche]
MNFDNINVPQKLIPENYWRLGLAAQRPKKRGFKELLEKRKLPVNGWPDEHIEELVHQIASLDSNNFPHKVGLGEREARIACRLVSRRHYNFGHGIGRSGDLLEAQPKAAGSTLIAHLTNALILDLIKGLGLPSCRGCFLVPMCTGMTITLCLQSLRKQRPLAKYVLWSRIDQKSCFKAITAAGLEPVIVPCLVQHQALSTDVNAFEQQVEALGAETILCLYTTTSCFAPRNSDNIVDIAQLAKRFDLPHLVNNAYGLQIGEISRQLERAQRLGRVDYFVQSSDKNLLVPVGGAIVASFDQSLLSLVGSSYAGRASGSQTLDVFMTLLSLGRSGYHSMLEKRVDNFNYLKEQLMEFAQSNGELVIESRDNFISLAITLGTLWAATGQGSSITQLGAMLHMRGVSGVRVVVPGQSKVIDGHTFPDFGSHQMKLELPYLTVAAAIGISREEIDKFFKIFKKCWTKLSQSLSENKTKQ